MYEAAARGISVSCERAGQPALRLVVGQGLTSHGHLPRQRPSASESVEPVAEALGISIYAKQLVDGRDRKQLERLARYITRPAAAPGDQQSLPLGAPDADPPRAGRARWGWLIGPVFLADVEHCSRCSGPLRWGCGRHPPREAISRRLAKHGLGPRPAPPSRSPPNAERQLRFAFARSAR